MGVYYNLKPIKNAVLALGFFDGVHLAHQKLILKTVELAKKSNSKSVLITFSASPYTVITKTPGVYITKNDVKINKILNLGIDEIFVLNFEEFKNITAEDYIKKVLIYYFAPKYVLTGFNHTFGLNKQGNSKLLFEYFNHIELPGQYLQNKLISSTNIKKAIQTGEIELANKMLNGCFCFKGRVVKGASFAEKLGYKTANIMWDDEIIRPKHGVYSGYAEYNNQKYTAIINFGHRPTIDDTLSETLEVHLDDFDGNLYGKVLNVGFLNYLRDEIKFSSADALKAQIKKDILKHQQCAKQNKNSAK